MFLHVFRCLGYVVRGMWRPKVGPLDTCRSRVYVGFRKLDAFLHVNNSRYLEVFEFARWEHGVRSGVFRHRDILKCFPVITNIHVQYVSQLKAFQWVTVETTVRSVHDKTLLLEQRILFRDPKSPTGESIAAAAVVKVIFLANGKTVDVPTAMRFHGSEGVSNALPKSSSAQYDAPDIPGWCASLNKGDDAWRLALRPPKP